MRALALVLATWLAVSSSTSVALAEDGSRFRELVREATEAFGQGKFERAIELVDQAYAIKKHPRLLYNRARAHEALGHFERAIADYEAYLAREPASEDREIVSGRIKALRSQLAQRERMAGERAEAAGRRASAKRHYARYLELAPSAADRSVIARRVRELEKPPPPKPELPPEREGPGAAPWITLGAGGVGIAAGGVLAVLSRQSYDDAEGASSGARAAELRDRGDGLTTGANVAFVIGGVAVVSSLLWLWLDGS